MSELDEALSGDLLKNVNMEVHVAVGRAHPTVETLLKLGPESILPLEQTINDPVEVYIGDKLIACGHLEEVENDPTGRLAVRITAVGDLMDGLK